MNPIVMIYVDLIKKGKKTIDDVKPSQDIKCAKRRKQQWTMETPI